MEPKLLCPNTNHTPNVEYDDADHDDIKHVFGGEVEALLDFPEDSNADGLSCDANDEKVGEGEGIVGDDCVLEGGY